MLQLCCCIEAHLKENTNYFQVPGGREGGVQGRGAPCSGLHPTSHRIGGKWWRLSPQFFADVKEAEEFLRKTQEALRKKFSCDRSTTVTRLEDLLQDCQVSAGAVQVWPSGMALPVLACPDVSLSPPGREGAAGGVPGPPGWAGQAGQGGGPAEAPQPRSPRPGPPASPGRL